ncbi:MAG: hypothetical protein WB808_15270 [Candidatus Dormiibacterota bacterium]
MGRSRRIPPRSDLLSIIEHAKPCTVRQAFYQATVHGVVPKTEAGYDKVRRLLVETPLDEPSGSAEICT